MPPQHRSGPGEVSPIHILPFPALSKSLLSSGEGILRWWWQWSSLAGLHRCVQSSSLRSLGSPTRPRSIIASCSWGLPHVLGLNINRLRVSPLLGEWCKCGPVSYEINLPIATITGRRRQWWPYRVPYLHICLRHHPSFPYIIWNVPVPSHPLLLKRSTTSLQTTFPPDFQVRSPSIVILPMSKTLQISAWMDTIISCITPIFINGSLNLTLILHHLVFNEYFFVFRIEKSLDLFDVSLEITTIYIYICLLWYDHQHNRALNSLNIYWNLKAFLNVRWLWLPVTPAIGKLNKSPDDNETPIRFQIRKFIVPPSGVWITL